MSGVKGLESIGTLTHHYPSKDQFNKSKGSSMVVFFSSLLELQSTSSYLQKTTTENWFRAASSGSRVAFFLSRLDFLVLGFFGGSPSPAPSQPLHVCCLMSGGWF